MKRILALAAFLSLLPLSIACAPRMVGSMAAAAVITGAVVGTAAAAAHDAHFHHYNCGCPRHYEGGRWVYFYHGGYEYFDPHDGVWYRY